MPCKARRSAAYERCSPFCMLCWCAGMRSTSKQAWKNIFLLLFRRWESCLRQLVQQRRRPVRQPRALSVRAASLQRVAPRAQRRAQRCAPSRVRPQPVQRQYPVSRPPVSRRARRSTTSSPTRLLGSEGKHQTARRVSSGDDST